jgi:two-component system nitrogen regulation response regulator NtrX
LRERTEDVPLLLHHFFIDLGAEKAEIGADAVEVLFAHDWPGNVRELRNLAERILVMYQGEQISAGMVTDLLRKTPESFGGKRGEEKTGAPAAGGAGNPLDLLPAGILERNLNEARESFEKFFLEYQLSRNGGIIARTAEAIGIYPSNLHAKLRKYKITMANPENGHGEKE